MSGSLPPPLGGPAPPEMPLARSPLARVLSQVRFSPVLRIGTTDGVTAFQDQIRKTYPLFEPVPTQQMQIEMGADGPAIKSTPGMVWRFRDAENVVQLSLTTDTVTLEAMTYEGRDLFLARWIGVINQIESEFGPGLILRCGMRYVNRIVDGEWLTRLPEFVAGSLVGMAQPEFRGFVSQTLSEASTKVAEGEMLLRWGVLARNTTIDPGILTPVPDESWILDIDVFSSLQRRYNSTEINQLFRDLSERAYTVFRHAITHDGLKFLGG